jgi:Protein of unknown function (DUF1573)
MARLFLSAVIGLLVVMPAPAATWADSLFDNLTHDFGVVARGPTVSHSFRIANTTSQPVHISSIRVSCGCTSAGVRTADLAPGQSTDLIAQMDTHRFVGPKSVTIYVQFDRPQWEEVRLTVSANGRDDLALIPDSIAFGSIIRGSSPTKSATLTFHGAGTHLVSVQAESNYVQLAAKNIRRTEMELAYEITATLRPDTPIGNWYTDIWLTTNNPSGQRIRLPLSVDITPALQFSAPVLAFGPVKPGDKVEKRIIVRGPTPFRITSIGGTNETVTATISGDETPKPAHVIVVGIKSGNAGALTHTLKITTDLADDNTAELPITANVVMPKAD